MKFYQTPLPGVRLIELEPRADDRGYFVRAFCQNEFGSEGLNTNFVQMNESLSVKKGTLRGMHFQLPPAAEVKVVRCKKGALYDVVLDLRPDSPTFCQSFGAELTEDNRRMMYVPKGCAHGFLTLQENTQALYFVSAFYAPDHERGVRFNDGKFNIEWPAVPTEISAKDQTWPSFDPVMLGVDAMRGLVPSARS